MLGRLRAQRFVAGSGGMGVAVVLFFALASHTRALPLCAHLGVITPAAAIRYLLTHLSKCPTLCHRHTTTHEPPSKTQHRHPPPNKSNQKPKQASAASAASCCARRCRATTSRSWPSTTPSSRASTWCGAYMAVEGCGWCGAVIIVVQ